MVQMRIKLHGVRGSRPTHKPELLGFGGNSTNMEFIIPGKKFHLFLDGGSGLVNRGRELTQNPENNEFHFLITHTHWDHVLGFPFFQPIYNASNEVTFYASNTSRASFNELFFGQNQSENLPVPASEIRAQIKFRTVLPDASFNLDSDTIVKTLQINHQGVTLGYRVEHGGKSICVITDNAPIEDNYMGERMAEKAAADPKAFEKEFNNNLINFLENADVVVFDTHFTEENLKADWGHSTPERALDFCNQAKVKTLVLFHHAPEDADSDVQAKVDSVFEKGKQLGIDVFAAKEGCEW